MPTTIYDETQSSARRSKGELVQIGLLSIIILVFFVIVAGNTVALLVNAFHR